MGGRLQLWRFLVGVKLTKLLIGHGFLEAVNDAGAVAIAAIAKAGRSLRRKLRFTVSHKGSNRFWWVSIGCICYSGQRPKA
uniref:Uncharacterized 8.8 kDa protein in atpI 5'region n=1 Tax=Synechococcus sp. (strain PCC 6716) TaxID=32048 RepID=YAT2_SYNP1|nr:RecName: Full=Uncharacterized 8.8 kDa protein in atpI 5'region; AltName: Full=URF2 [Synechococcus sp. PCC 6716]pir/S36968/ hypothetical protein 2 (uncI 5' region) - Synechococcus sp. (PCC 6716) [Synechococcus sp.]CAA49878.1 unnamed protein product [Synechococcus sp.]